MFLFIFILYSLEAKRERPPYFIDGKTEVMSKVAGYPFISTLEPGSESKMAEVLGNLLIIQNVQKNIALVLSYARKTCFI